MVISSAVKFDGPNVGSDLLLFLSGIWGIVVLSLSPLFVV